MELPQPEAGLVIRYNFLWPNEADHGREDGSKARPCAIVTAVARSGDRTIVTVAPITHTPRGRERESIELPLAIKQALGLDDERSWIVTDELNTFAWPGTDLEPIRSGSSSAVYGRLPRKLMIAILRAALGHVRRGRTRTVRRTE